MAMDDNRFDRYLKKQLHRDLLFRAIAWFGISMATGYVSIHVGGATASAFFERASDTLIPLVNTVGVGGLLLCALALFLKDLEFVSKDPRITASTGGMIGGFVRRFAGDISLWTLGASITMSSALILALILTPMSAAETGAIAFLTGILAILIVVTGVLNVFVRRSGPTPWGVRAKSTRLLTAGYAFAFLALLAQVVKTAASASRG